MDVLLLRSDDKPALVGSLGTYCLVALSLLVNHRPTVVQSEHCEHLWNWFTNWHWRPELANLIPCSMLCFLYLIEFATAVVNQHLVGKDGLTVFERMKHKLHKKSQGVAPFGCQVMLRVSGKVAGGVLGERWFPGIWPASQASSGEHLVAINSDGKSMPRLCRTPESFENDKSVKPHGILP